MDTFLARQPVFDRDVSVFGYEMSFSQGVEKAFSLESGEAPTAQVIEQMLNEFGVVTLAQGRKTFVRVTPNLIRQGIAGLLPRENTVLLMPEKVAEDRELLSTCRSLRNAGFPLAIEDYQGTPAADELVALAAVLRVDFRRVDADLRKKIASSWSAQVNLLGNRVESYSEFKEAAQVGFTYFQGPFFAKPELLGQRALPGSKLNYLQLLSEVNRPGCDFDSLERLVRQDLTLSVKLLRYINSATFSLKGKVEDLKKALTLLGLKLLKKWVSLLSVAAMSDGKPQELVVTSLIRARFCEEFGKKANFQSPGFDLFMTGMLSCLDAILDRPMKELLSDLPLADGVKEALQGNRQGVGKALGLIKSYEKADWQSLANHADGYAEAMREIPKVYRESVSWAHEVTRTVA